MEWVLSLSINRFVTRLWLLLVAHAVTDCLLQDPKLTSIGVFKNRHRGHAKKAFGEGGHEVYWLVAHGLLNGLGVFCVTLNPWLGIFETVSHTLIDFGKIEGKYGVHLDQSFHLGTKILWCILA